MSKFQRIQPNTAMGIDFRYMPILIVFALCFYFSYHLMQGKRSVWAYFSNTQIMSEKAIVLEGLQREAAQLETNNKRLRIGSVDPDFVEERAREQLGYTRETEIMMVDQ